MHGLEVVLPIKEKIPSLRILIQTKLEDIESSNSLYNQLNFTNKKIYVSLSRALIPKADFMSLRQKV